ncbi:uncharacterized protein LOC134817664 [Bolinopsis microptera]|uniref:uncharacterized protein LOC134817664 n=1 Tax=Bolinopsis microptera TaxID=2820187 RepID=UPI003079BA16
MVRLIVLIIMATLLLAALGNPGKPGRGGRGDEARGKKPVAMCRYLDNCNFPFFPWCLQDFNVAATGRTILYSRPRSGLLTSGTKKRDKMGSIVLFSEEEEVIELTLEMALAKSRNEAAQMFVTVFRSMCPDFLADITLCDPMFTHDEAFPIFDSCDVFLKDTEQKINFNSLRLETDGVFLQLFFNDVEIGKLALPHIGCDVTAPRVEITKVGFTNKPRSMSQSPMCCN